LDWRCDGLTAPVSLTAGKAADLVVLAGNRAKNIDDVEPQHGWVKRKAGKRAKRRA